MSCFDRIDRRQFVKLGASVGAQPPPSCTNESRPLYRTAAASVQPPQTALPRNRIPQFVSPLTTFVGQRVTGSSLQVRMFEFQQQVQPASIYRSLPQPFRQGTYLWGYAVGAAGSRAAPPYPGVTVECQSGTGTTVKYVNNLPQNLSSASASRSTRRFTGPTRSIMGTRSTPSPGRYRPWSSELARDRRDTESGKRRLHRCRARRSRRAPSPTPPEPPAADELGEPVAELARLLLRRTAEASEHRFSAAAGCPSSTKASVKNEHASRDQGCSPVVQFRRLSSAGARPGIRTKAHARDDRRRPLRFWGERSRSSRPPSSNRGEWFVAHKPVRAGGHAGGRMRSSARCAVSARLREVARRAVRRVPRGALAGSPAARRRGAETRRHGSAPPRGRS